MVIAAAGLVLLGIVASALIPASHPEHRTLSTPAGTAHSSVTTSAGTPRQRSPVSAAELARAREVAAQFLESYLPFLYGRGPARLVGAVTPALRWQLTRERAQVTPVERWRHPRMVSLQAAGQAPGVALATAMVEDGGLTTYPLRLTLQKGPRGWVVSGLDGG